MTHLHDLSADKTEGNYKGRPFCVYRLQKTDKNGKDGKGVSIFNKKVRQG